MRALLAALPLLLVGCGAAAPTEGTITSLDFIPAHDVKRSEDVYETECGYTYGLKMDGTFGLVWECHDVYDHTRHWVEHVPDCWRVTFEDSSGREGKDCTTQGRYVEMDVGDYYDPKP